MLLEQNYPKVVRVRPYIVIAVTLGFIVLVLILVYNFKQYHTHSTTQETAENQTLTKATQEDVQQVQKNKAVVTKQTAIATPVNAMPTTVIAATPQPTVTSSPVADEILQKAMSAPITANQLIGQIDSDSNNRNTSPPSVNSAVMPGNPNQDPNPQLEKQRFLEAAKQMDDNYLHVTLKKPLSPYELKASTKIPGVLLTGINSELPGPVTGQVTAPVYDSIAGRYVLIPAGAKLYGEYDSQIVYGQRRVLVVWQRILFPNGNSINLLGMPGVDVSGYSGFKDQVDNHYLKLFGSVLLMSTLAAGAQLSQPQQQFDNNGQISINQTLAQSLGVNIANTANHLVQKNLSIPPTLKIRPGYVFDVEIKKDIVFPGAYSPEITLQNAGTL